MVMSTFRLCSFMLSMSAVYVYVFVYVYIIVHVCVCLYVNTSMFKPIILIERRKAKTSQITVDTSLKVNWIILTNITALKVTQQKLQKLLWRISGGGGGDALDVRA